MDWKTALFGVASLAGAFVLWSFAKLALAFLKSRADETPSPHDDEALEEIEDALDKLKPGD